MEDIYWAAKWQGKYHPLFTDTEVNNIISAYVYTKPVKYIATMICKIVETLLPRIAFLLKKHDLHERINNNIDSDPRCLTVWRWAYFVSSYLLNLYNIFGDFISDMSKFVTNEHL